MGEGSKGGEKTEKPTQHKLNQARKKGQVAFGVETPSALVLVGLFCLFGLGWKSAISMSVDLITNTFSYIPLITNGDFNAAIGLAFWTMSALTLPVIAVAALSGIAGCLVQTGFILAPEKLKPSMENLSPASGLKKIVSPENLFEFAKSILKTAFFSLLFYILIREGMDLLIKMPYSGLGAIGPAVGGLMTRAAWFTGVSAIALAGVDIVFQRFQFQKKMRMTKDEIKREFKENEGDPLMKNRRRQAHREIMMHDITERVRRSSVLITNPTHVAVALFYDEKNSPLPIITAKGTDEVAKRMREIAREENIPIMENVPLARALYEDAAVDQYIPSELVKPVAEVLRWLLKTRQLPSSTRDTTQ